MPFNVDGIFQRLFNWRNDRDAGIKILAERMDQELDGIADGINDVVAGNVAWQGPMTGVFGTAAAPAYSFSDDPDTGTYRSGVNKLAFAVGGQLAGEFLDDRTFDLKHKLTVAGVDILSDLQSGIDTKATPADIQAAIDGLLDAAPGTLDTLNELAAALGDDPNFSATVTAQIAGKLDAGATAVDADKLGGVAAANHVRKDQDGNISAHTEWQDGYQVRVGNSADGRFQHDGTNTFLESHNAGSLYLVSRVHGGEVIIGGEKSDGNYRTGFIFQDGYYCRFYYDNSEKMRTDSSGVTVYGRLHADDKLYVGKNGGGDSWIDFYDDNSNTWRALGWDDSANSFVAEENDGGFHKLSLVYDGSTHSNTNYPIGTTVIVSISTSDTARNASRTVRYYGGNTYQFSNNSGTALTGTWRARGRGNSHYADLFQRVA